MIGLQTRLALLERVFLLVFSALIAEQSYALQPSAAQIQMFKQMSPGEQGRLAKQFGVDIPQTAVIQAPVPAQKNTVVKRDVPEAASNDDVQENIDEDDLSQNEVKLNAPPLKAFGYDLFAGKPASFTPINDIPVSSDYVLGAGDSLKVNLYGKESRFFELEIDQEGMVYLPDLGPLSLAGLSFSDAKKSLINTVGQKMIGVKASVSMGRLRSIRVFVLGEAYQPGSYVVSSLSTITNALVLSGGVTTNGSLRTIQLKRRGKLIETLDLYDLLLKGDTANDAQLKSGDVVFIPPVGFTVGIRGEVRRPAIYEIDKNDTAKKLISYAGGLLSSAYPKLSKVQRIGEDEKKNLLDVDLSQESQQFKLENGDGVYIPASLGILNSVINVAGEVLHSGMQNWQPGMRASDAIAVAGLTPNTDLQYALVKRLLADGRIEILLLELSHLLERVGSPLDIELQQLDDLLFFSWSGGGRQLLLKEVVDQLEAQTKAGKLTNKISIEGSVRFSGGYPLTKGMVLSDALMIAGVEAETDPNYALLVRLTENQQWEVRAFQPSDIMGNAASLKNIALEPLDRILLFSKLADDRQAQVEFIVDSLRAQAGLDTPAKETTVTGSVRFPGTYPLSEGMTAVDLVYAAGGLTESAFQLLAELSRSEFTEQQERKNSRYNLNLSEVETMDFVLKSRDRLQVRTKPNWSSSEQVELKGEVKFPGIYPIYKNDTLAMLLDRAGGLTEFAYAAGAMFTRVDLRKQQALQLKKMQDRLAEDIAKAELVAANQGAKNQAQGDTGEAQKVLSQLNSTAATGRLVIDMKKVLSKDAAYSIPLQDGDTLFVPTKKNSVTLIGEVQLPISQVYDPDLMYVDYIERSGGFTDKADGGRVYIIKANGAVKMPNSSSWFAGDDGQLAPGDTIVVPLDADKLDQIVLWRDMSQIFYQIALGVVAAGSL